MQRLLEVVARLRGPDGCPWDREQTLDTLRPYLVEESYELLEALDANDPLRHKDELGDVLLQVVLQSRIREEEGAFCLDDVAHTLCDKLIRRHPHVFGDVDVADADEVIRNWEAIKADEKGSGPGSVLDGVPRELPALHRAQRVQSRASRVGFDWADKRDVLGKVDEELGELKDALGQGDGPRVRDEIGDLLFSIVNLCRFERIHAEEALRQTIAKFSRRFVEIEKRVREEGRTLETLTLAEMDRHWDAIKREERE